MLPSLPHLLGAGWPQAPGHQRLQLLVLRAAVECGAAVPTGKGERGAGRGGDTREEHTAGINHAGKVPKRVGVPSGVPALAGIEQHRPILAECTKLHLKHQFPI